MRGWLFLLLIYVSVSALLLWGALGKTKTRIHRTLTIVIHFVVAIALIVFGLGVIELTYGNPKKGVLYNLAVPLLFIVPGLIVTMRIAWLLRRPRSDHSKETSLWLTLPLSLGFVSLVVAIVVFVVLVWFV